MKDVTIMKSTKTVKNKGMHRIRMIVEARRTLSDPQ